MAGVRQSKKVSVPAALEDFVRAEVDAGRIRTASEVVASYLSMPSIAGTRSWMELKALSGVRACRRGGWLRRSARPGHRPVVASYVSMPSMTWYRSPVPGLEWS
jgi:hypothetical protein